MILHVNNTAGVASILAKYQRRKETSLVIARATTWDVCGHGLTYGGLLDPRSIRPLYYVLIGSLAMKARVVHVHGAIGVNRKVRLMLNKMTRKRIVEYHGYRAIQRDRRWSKEMESRAEIKVLVSTPNLLRYFKDAEWLPNPIDPELFFDFRLPNFRLGRGLTFIKYRREYMLEYLKPIIAEIEKDYDIEIDIHVCRSRNDVVPHRRMAELYNHYEFYIDLAHGYDKDHAIIEAYSLMGLQALACGCKVITAWDGLKTGLPEIHRADNVVNRLEKIAQEI